ncbi:hypothetical protein IWW50_004317, partial [Coemansia erecta]
MRKSYSVLQQLRQPPTVIFLGDLMDGGREWTHSVWLEEYKRFLSIFASRQSNAMRVYHMAGNHDIGIGNTVVQPALRRFHDYVGPTNQIIDIGGHQIILLDTLTLESDSAAVNTTSKQVVEWLRSEYNERKLASRPRILFSHVPLWRPEKTYCGPLRQDKHAWLLDRRGYQFRDQLFENTTAYILDAIQPDAVFSGDDHDTCTITHTI